jgi:hypothetical protein
MDRSGKVDGVYRKVRALRAAEALAAAPRPNTLQRPPDSTHRGKILSPECPVGEGSGPGLGCQISDPFDEGETRIGRAALCLR